MKTVFSAEQIRGRLEDLAQQISADYKGRTIYAVCVMENSFVFMADLVRLLTCDVFCQFVKPVTSVTNANNVNTTEIRFTPELEVAGKDVLLIEGIVQTGITSDFLYRTILAKGANSVRIATLVDRHSERHIELQPDYYGFLYSGGHLTGYGLADAKMGRRNLPFLATLEAPESPS